MKNPRPHKRYGITLIELITIMSALSVLLVINAKWIHQSIEFASTTKKRQRYQHAIKRIASNLRDDVRQCRQMSVNNENRLTLVGSRNRITTYTIDGMKLRVEKKEEDESIFRDVFDLGPQADIQWDVSEMPEWISLVVSRKAPNPKSSDRPQPGDAENNNRWSPLDRLPPIDLHVRAGPNPWK